MATKQSIRERFERFVEPVPPGTCWIWLGAVLENGYGAFFVSPFRKAAKAHRIAWEFANGAVPKGRCILHKCDVKLCVNPDHLYVGTHDDNMRDKTLRLRIHGERNPRSILTEADVLYIRSLPYKRGLFKTLARQFKVSGNAIGNAYNRDSWPHI